MQEGSITASYNALNQPIAMWSPAYNGTPNYMWFGYDPLGRCVKSWLGPVDGTAPNGTTYFYYDGWNMIEDGASPWNPENFYIHARTRCQILRIPFAWL